MSVICAVRKGDEIAMAADSLTLFGDDDVATPENASSRKMMQLGSSVIGGAGWGLYDDIFRDYLDQQQTPDLGSEVLIFRFFLDLWKALHETYTFVNDQAASKDTPFGDLDSTFLIANANGLFKVSSDLCVTRFSQYCAIGSGSHYAYGAMHTLYDRPTETAISIARAGAETGIALNAHCGGAIDILLVPAMQPTMDHAATDGVSHA